MALSTLSDVSSSSKNGSLSRFNLAMAHIDFDESKDIYAVSFLPFVALDQIEEDVLLHQNTTEESTKSVSSGNKILVENYLK